jgi:hypothetical protein
MVELQILESLAAVLSYRQMGDGEQRNAASMVENHSQLHEVPFSANQTGCHFRGLCQTRKSLDQMLVLPTTAIQTSAFPSSASASGEITVQLQDNDVFDANIEIRPPTFDR